MKKATDILNDKQKQFIRDNFRYKSMRQMANIFEHKHLNTIQKFMRQEHLKPTKEEIYNFRRKVKSYGCKVKLHNVPNDEGVERMRINLPSEQSMYGRKLDFSKSIGCRNITDGFKKLGRKTFNQQFQQSRYA